MIGLPQGGRQCDNPRMSDDLDLIAVATELAYATQVVGNSFDSLPGFAVDRVFDDLWDNTGFYAVAFAHREHAQMVVAIRGSEDRLDVVSDASLGVSQYLANRQPLVEYVGENILGNRITIAGHSLGGGLSQYLGYDAALAYPVLRDHLVIHTHNGFGGIIGITKMHGRYDPAVLEGVTIRNYRHPDDPVSRIGGHCGAIFNLIDPDPLPNGILYAHSNKRFLKQGDRSPFADAVAAIDDAFDITQTLEELGPQLSQALLQLMQNDRPVHAVARIGRLVRMVPEKERASFFALVRDVMPFSRTLQRMTRRGKAPTQQ